MEKTEMRMKPGDIVRHFKGNPYQILYFAKDSETQRDVVVYRALYGEGGVWVAPDGDVLFARRPREIPECGAGISV